MNFHSSSTAARVLVATLIVAAVVIICNVVLLLTLGLGIIPYQAARPATSLIQAVRGNDIPAVESLLNAGANVDEKRGYSWHLGSCFIVACSGSGERFGQTALTEAVDAESVPMITTLLDHGARIDLPDNHGQDALAHAMTQAITRHVSQPDPAILGLLLQRHRGAVRETSVTTALNQAVANTRPDLVRQLLPFSHDETSMFPAMCTAATASTRESMELFDMLLQKVGRIPSEIAGCAGSLYALKNFLDHGLDPNARYQNGPTMLAQHTQRIDPSLETTCDCSKLEEVYMVQLLLKHGADPKLGGFGTLSALDQAHAEKRPHLTELLLTGKMLLPSEDGTPQSCPPIALCPRTLLPPEVAVTRENSATHR
jgi:ankyrin repeat protein